MIAGPESPGPGDCALETTIRGCETMLRLNCRLCGAVIVPAGVGAYFRCPACGGLFLAAPPTAPANAPFTGPEARRCEAADLERSAYFRGRLADAMRRTGPVANAPRLVDVGCGAGILLAEAAARGWQVAGVELSPELAAMARARVPGAVIVCGDAVGAPAWPWPGQADLVIALDVLEHVAEPTLLLARCRAALRPGGVLLLQTPNARSLRARWQRERWPMLDPAQHLVLYPPRELRRALQAAGFAVVSCRTVSGTGCETGLARAIAVLRGAVLAAGGLGNAVLLVGRAQCASPGPTDYGSVTNDNPR